jgi:hypothetical protein
MFEQPMKSKEYLHKLGGGENFNKKKPTWFSIYSKVKREIKIYLFLGKG